MNFTTLIRRRPLIETRLRLLDQRTALAFGLPFLLYVLTLAPTVYNLDSAELTTAAATGGIVRATGYPLYLLLGYAWSWLPVGDVGYRLNLFSAFNGALTVALADRILRRWQVGPWAAFGALGLLACAPYFWAMSLIAEVYTLHTALMAAIILLLLRWGDRPTPDRLALVGLALGLSLGHHAATVLLVPGCIFYVLTTAPRQAIAPRSIALAGGALLAGLSVYLYLPWRYSAGPAFNYAGLYDSRGQFVPVNLQTPDGLWWLVSGRSFAGEMLAYQGAELWHEVGRFGRQLGQAFFAIGIGPGLLGLPVLFWKNWRLGTTTLLMFAFSAGFYIDYKVVDKDTMFLPAYLIWALWVGVGYQWIFDWVGHAHPHPKKDQGLAPGSWLLRVVVAMVVFIAIAWNWSLVDQSDDWSTRLRGEEILDQVERGALVFGWWDTVPVLEYLQLVEGQRPDIKAVNRFLIEPEAMQRLIEREITRRSIYIDQPSAELGELVTTEPAGLLYRLRLRPDNGQLPRKEGSVSLEE